MVQQEAEEDIWGQILKEATRKTTDTIESRTVIVLGDRNSGKSSLLARTQNEDITDINKGVALTYTFLDSFEDGNEDPVGRIDFWQLEGEPAHADLLNFALNETTLPNAMAMIVLDFSHPWALASTLKKWLAILAEQIQKASKATKSLEDQLKLYAQTYKEPVSADASNTKKKLKKGLTTTEDPNLLPPLESAVLTSNLGIPIVVVCAKADSVSQLEKDFDYNEGIFEYIQQHLRRICLQYGATLIYTSARKETNCALLVDYIEHRLFGFELKQKAQLLEKDSLFVPFGWDSMAKIKLDFDNQKVCKDPEESFENVVKKPPFLKRREQTQAPTIAAEDDQTFLTKHKANIDTYSESEKKEPKGDQKSLLGMFKVGGSGVSSPTASLADEEGSASPGPSAHVNVSSPSVAQAASNLAAPTTAPAAAPSASTEKAVLANFFTSLMTKDSKSKLSAPSSKDDLKKTIEAMKKQAATPLPTAKKS